MEGVFAKKNFRCGRRFRCRRLRSAAVTRLWPRDKDRRPHSSLISGLLGLEASGIRSKALFGDKGVGQGRYRRRMFVGADHYLCTATPEPAAATPGIRCKPTHPSLSAR